MTLNEIRSAIYNDLPSDWERLMFEMKELSSSCADMFQNPDRYTENQKYELLDKFREICKVVGTDYRATGTLLKRLNF